MRKKNLVRVFCGGRCRACWGREDFFYERNSNINKRRKVFFFYHRQTRKSLTSAAAVGAFNKACFRYYYREKSHKKCDLFLQVMQDNL